MAQPHICRGQACRPGAFDALEKARDRLDCGPDVPDEASAIELIARLEGQCKWVKVGLKSLSPLAPRF